MTRLEVLAAEPVFYQVPLYRAVSKIPELDVVVNFLSSGGVRPYNAGFGTADVTWDVPLLGGYRHRFLSGSDESTPGGPLSLKSNPFRDGLRRDEIDALWVHGYAYVSNARAMLAAKRSGVPVLLREEQTLLDARPPVRAVPRWAVLRTLLRNVYALAIGQNSRTFFEHYGVPSDRIFMAPYCVDNVALRAQHSTFGPARASLQLRFGLEPELPTVLFLGKFVNKKRPQDLLDAFAGLPPGSQLLFVGGGPLEGELRRRTEDLALSRVHFAPFLNRSEIAIAYAVADIFVLPSAYQETWGLVVNEAMNFKLPVIVSDRVGCAADLVTDGVTGLQFPAMDVPSLQNALERLLSDPVLRSELGQAGFARVSTYTYDRAARGVVEACHAAADR